jgi:hypothetical protein
MNKPHRGISQVARYSPIYDRVQPNVSQFDDGPHIQYYVQLTKTLRSGRAMNPTKPAALVRAYLVDMLYHDACVTVLGVLIGYNSHNLLYVEDKFASCDRVSSLPR